MSTAVPDRRMTAEEFLTWVLGQPTGRFELSAGEVVAMAPERAAHARVKGAVFRALGDAIAGASLPCEALPDGMAVRIDDATVYEPDAAVRCGARLDDAALAYRDPVIVVEVLSPTTRGRDCGAKLDDYFRLASLVHYLIVKTETGTVIHHERAPDGAIATRILRDGLLPLDPPGLVLAIADFFRPARPAG